jgi:hypothetical protein
MNSSGHFCLNLTGSAQSLATGFTLGANDPEATAPIRWLSLQPLSANAAVVYVGFAGNVLSSSNYAFRLEIPVSTIPSAPFIIEGLMVSLNQIQVLGTTNEDLAVGYIRG